MPAHGESEGNISQVSTGGTTTKTVRTCQKTGLILIWVRCTFPADYGNVRQMVTINKNGEEIAREDGILYVANISMRREITTFAVCNPGDVITVSAMNSAGTSKQLTFDWRWAEIGV